MAKILGATVDEVEGTRALAWATEEALGQLLDPQARSPGTQEAIRTTVRRADGSTATVEAWSRAIERDGRTINLALVRETTAETVAQEALDLRGAAIESASDGIAILDGDGELVYLNPAFARIHGHDPPTELLGTAWGDLYPPSEDDRIETTVVPELADHGRWRGELEGLRRDGSTFPQETSLTLVNDEHITCIVRDITERREAEEAVRESEDRYRSLVEVVPDGIAVTCEDGVLFANERTVAMVGAASMEDLLGRCLADMVAEEDQAQVHERVEACLAGEHPDRVMTCIQRPDGSEMNIEIACSPTRFQGEPAAQLLLHDITQLKERQDELEALTEELEQRNDDLTAFARVAGHDLKEPLRMVAGFLDLFFRRYGETVATEEAAAFLEKAREGAQRAQELLEGLARYARVQAGSADHRPVDSLQALGKALSNLSLMIGEADAHIEWGQLPMVLADEAQLTQVFQNLISNAIKYSGQAIPEIQVWAEPVEGGWRFHVVDNGVGIQAEHQEAVFEPMRRLDRSQEGTGMGLAIIKRIVERHGGEIELTSTPGQGTEISFTMPGPEDAGSTR